MTMNYERRNAVNRTREFLYELMDSKKTPRVSKEIRDEARSCLKHFPSEYDMERAAEQAPEVFGDFEYYLERERLIEDQDTWYRVNYPEYFGESE